MTYFIHKETSGIAPQSGYQRISIYRNPTTGAIWVLWRTDKTPAEITAAIKGELMIVGQTPDTDILAAYSEIIAQKKAVIRAEGARRLTAIVGEYNAEERETWTEQKSQAEKVLAGAGAEEYPMLAAFAAGRGVPVETLATGIIENSNLFQAASGQVMGAMYALLDQVSYAADLGTALNVDWS
mgnify:CR=1 FL=1